MTLLRRTPDAVDALAHIDFIGRDRTILVLAARGHPAAIAVLGRTGLIDAG